MSSHVLRTQSEAAFDSAGVSAGASSAASRRGRVWPGSSNRSFRTALQSRQHGNLMASNCCATRVVPRSVVVYGPFPTGPVHGRPQSARLR